MKGKKRKPMPLILARLINQYQASGRVAVVYPFKGAISLNGGRAKSYSETITYLQDWQTKN